MPPAGYKSNPSPEGIARRAAARRRKLDALVAAMFAAYESEGISLAEVGRRFGRRSNTAVRNLFEVRGYPFRKDWRSNNPHAANGCFLRKDILTAAEVDALVDQATEFAVPPALRFTWRKWSLAERGAFDKKIQQLLRKKAWRDAAPGTYPVHAKDEAHVYPTPEDPLVAALRELAAAEAEFISSIQDLRSPRLRAAVEQANAALAALEDELTPPLSSS